MSETPGAAGFTVIEVLVCLFLLMFALLGLARTQAMIGSMIAAGQRSNRVAALAGGVDEGFRAGGCGVVTGEAHDGPLTASWSLEQNGLSRSVDIVVSSPGRGGMLVDSFRTVVPCPGGTD